MRDSIVLITGGETLPIGADITRQEDVDRIFGKVANRLKILKDVVVETLQRFENRNV